MSEQSTDNPDVKDAPVPEPTKPTKKRGSYKKRKKPAAKKQQPEPEQAPSRLSDSVPTTPGEVKDAAGKLINRGKEMGAKPILDALGGLANRFFGAVNSFFDDMEGKKK